MYSYRVRKGQHAGTLQFESVGRIFTSGAIFELSEREFRHPDIQSALTQGSLVFVNKVSLSSSAPTDPKWDRIEALILRVVDRIADRFLESPSSTTRKAPRRKKRSESPAPLPQRQKKPVRAEPSEEMFLLSADVDLSSVSIQTETATADDNLSDISESLRKVRENS